MLTFAEPPTAATSEDKRPHAVVIGSGFGGLAAAVRLGARGYRVTVLERLEQAGGRASVFRQDGFTFDAGPTIITLPFLFEELWEMAGRRFKDDIDLRPLNPFYRILFDDGEHFDCSGEEEIMRAEIMRLSPADLEGYERFMKHSEAVFKIGFEELAHLPFDTLTKLAGSIPKFARHRADRSVYGLASRFIKDERLRFAFSFHPLFIGGNPFRATSIYSLVSHIERRWGVHFPMGGTGSLVKGLVNLIEGQGSRIRYHADIAEILLRGRAATGVRLTSGEIVPADIVVSNGDPAWTYKHLVPASARRRWTDRKIARMRYSMSLFVWYFGTNRTYPDVHHHTIALGPRYRGLIEDIFDRKVLADDFSLYLHRPTATDPALAPPGCDTFYALSPVPHLESGIDWELEAEPYRRRIEKALSESILPGLKDTIVTSRLMTPVDFRDRLLSHNGAAFSIEPIFTQSAWFRPHNRSEDIDRLYLVGAGTHPGAGVPSVLSSARVLDHVVPHAEALA